MPNNTPNRSGKSVRFTLTTAELATPLVTPSAMPATSRTDADNTAFHSTIRSTPFFNLELIRIKNARDDFEKARKFFIAGQTQTIAPFLWDCKPSLLKLPADKFEYYLMAGISELQNGKLNNARTFLNNAHLVYNNHSSEIAARKCAALNKQTLITALSSLKEKEAIAQQNAHSNIWQPQ